MQNAGRNLEYEDVGVDHTLDAYERAIESLTVPAVKASPDVLLCVLIARDAVAASFAKGRDTQSASRLLASDEMLKSVAADVSDALPPDCAESWRDSFCPKTEAWWWRLEQVSAKRLEQRSPWWPVATGILLTVSASITADIARRFLSNGPDFYGALSTITQGAVTIIAGSSLTQAGRGWIGRWLRSFGAPADFHPRWFTVLALAVLLLVSLFHFALPWIAIHYYDRRGQELFNRGQLRNAIEHFQRATSLSPSEFRPHYNLGDAYEEFLDVDKAISEYQAAVQANPAFYPAYNNLARLYLIKRKDYEGALRAIRKGMNRLESDRKVRRAECPSLDPQCEAVYALHKNLAWVNVENKWFNLARIEVDAARQAKPDGAAVQCLLAQIEVAESNPAAATMSWGRCLAKARRQFQSDVRAKREDVEETWIAMAEEWESKLK